MNKAIPRSLTNVASAAVGIRPSMMDPRPVAAAEAHPGHTS